MSTPTAIPPHTPEQLFRFSRWIHVGAGAEACEDVDEAKGEVNCGDAAHFHAWITLPNQFQHREIREKALAAKARVARQMRHEGSDAYEVLEADLDQLLMQGEAARPALIDEIVGKDWWRDYMEAQRDIAEEEDPNEDGAKLYAGIMHDRARLQVLEAMPEDERPKDEYDELYKHVAEYHAKVKKSHDERVQPKRDALKDRPLDDLISMVRADRIDRASNEEFQHAYSAEAWLVGTRRRPGISGERYFATADAMKSCAPEVLGAIEEAFADMERAAQEVTAEGNS